MAWRRLLLPGVIVAALLVALTGCGAGSFLTLTPEEDDLVACEPGLSIDVESLGTGTRPSCDPLDSDLIFPDGTRLFMDDWAGSGSTTISESPFSYGFYNVGVFGVVASRYDTDCSQLEIWGREEAVSRLRDAFGEHLGNC